MILRVNYVTYGWSFVRTNPGVSLYRSLALERNIAAVITQDRPTDEIVLVDYSY